LHADQRRRRNTTPIFSKPSATFQTMLAFIPQNVTVKIQGARVHRRSAWARSGGFTWGGPTHRLTLDSYQSIHCGKRPSCRRHERLRDDERRAGNRRRLRVRHPARSVLGYGEHPRPIKRPKRAHSSSRKKKGTSGPLASDYLAQYYSVTMRSPAHLDCL